MVKERPEIVMARTVWSGNEGLFVNTKVSGIPVTMLVDTGASITILKTDYLRCLPKTVTEHVKMVTSYLVSATGDRTPFKESVMLVLKLAINKFSMKYGSQIFKMKELLVLTSCQNIIVIFHSGNLNWQLVV